MPSRRSATGGRAPPKIQAALVGAVRLIQHHFWCTKNIQLVQGRLANVLLFLDNVGTRAIRVVYYD